MPTLTDRITAGLNNSLAAELADIDEQLDTLGRKAARLLSRRAQLKEQAQRQAQEIAERQVAPVEQEQDAERFDGMS